MTIFYLKDVNIYVYTIMYFILLVTFDTYFYQLNKDIKKSSVEKLIG